MEGGMASQTTEATSGLTTLGNDNLDRVSDTRSLATVT